ncbi:MAG: hypothetical protein IPL61_24585 [Myxococcales bacterium]|nr:hypothetical protein [Myxococcales bacterium]
MLLVAVVGATGCVEAFDGSNVQLDLASGVQTNTRPGGVPAPDQPPENTHYVLYAADLVYQTNADGTIVIDASGDPVVDRSYLFEVQEFMVRSVIDTSSPCLIDLEDTRFPGIHVTQYAAAVRTATGITDPFAPNQNRDDVIDVLTADRRVANLPQVEGALKVVSSFANYRYPAIGTACVGQPGADPLLVPPPTCVDAASNAQRLALCKRAWADNPDWYEGSDKVFTLPLNGRFFGMVEGMNPVNQGFVGGSSFFVHQNLVGLDAYLLNWQYDDLDHNGAPDFPASVPMDQRSDTGYLYMQGRPKSVVRGVTTVPMYHATNPRIAATMVIFPNLGDDSVHF